MAPKLAATCTLANYTITSSTIIADEVGTPQHRNDRASPRQGKWIGLPPEDVAFAPSLAPRVRASESLHPRLSNVDAEGVSLCVVATSDRERHGAAHLAGFLWASGGREFDRGDLHRVLGLPWQEEVDAMMGIRYSFMDMGDVAEGERVEWVQGRRIFIPLKCVSWANPSSGNPFADA
ncbi:hypothetical protein DSL72_007969 [Monilinia vaccinii-corymbosi]|uniref:Uncharacterized protein n=1 Tax=Monilinia vaccinii-corymbosi TaxID=61207 RepID=A0A8A3PJB6_9HELO|nr:hypothetical protein DSL72_007969 [Monilinia vaccinii-corymbosi]